MPDVLRRTMAGAVILLLPPAIYLTIQAIEARSPEPDNTAALKAIKGEPEVLGAEWEEKSSVWEKSTLWVEARDDGKRGFGFAAHLCEVVREHHGPKATIRVMDVETGDELRAHQCF